MSSVLILELIFLEFLLKKINYFNEFYIASYYVISFAQEETNPLKLGCGYHYDYLRCNV